LVVGGVLTAGSATGHVEKDSKYTATLVIVKPLGKKLTFDITNGNNGTGIGGWQLWQILDRYRPCHPHLEKKIRARSIVLLGTFGNFLFNQIADIPSLSSIITTTGSSSISTTAPSI